MRRPAVFLSVLLLAFAACTKGVDKVPAGAVRTGKAPLTLEDLKAGTMWKLEPRDGYGYRILDGADGRVGKVKVQADRVKVKDGSDQPRAKVEKKDGGFKLYDANDKVVLQGKDRGDRLKLESDDGALKAKLRDGALRVGAAKIRAVKEGDETRVVREDDPLFALRGDVPPDAAMLYGWTELDPYQRIALLVFLREVY